MVGVKSPMNGGSWKLEEARDHQSDPHERNKREEEKARKERVSIARMFVHSAPTLLDDYVYDVSWSARPTCDAK